MPTFISYVIPYYNNIDLLKRCLASINQQTYRPTKSEIIIVDDCSTDNSLLWLKNNYPSIVLERNFQNLGFTRTANRGLKRAQGEWIILINTDVELTINCVTSASVWFDKKGIGSIAFSLRNMKRPELYDSAGDIFTIAGYAQKRKERLPVRENFLESGAVFSGSGAAVAYRSSALRDVGYFDESFEAYYEDVDLGMRLRLAGYECVFEKDAVAYHLSGGSYYENALATKREFLLSRNAEKLFFKYFPEIFSIPHLIRHLIVLFFHIIAKVFTSRSWTHFVNGKLEGLRLISKLQHKKVAPYYQINKQAVLRALDHHWITSHFSSWVKKAGGNFGNVR